METVATLAIGLLVDVGGAFKQVETGLGGLANLAATGGKLIAEGIAVGTAAIVAFAKSSVDLATSFESQMAIMSTAVEPMGPSLETLHDVMLKIGADNELIGITASQAAEATTNFYKAGLTTTDIMGDLNAYMNEGVSLTGALRAAIDLAAASDLELAEASSLVAITMAQYGLSAEEATGITDIFVKAANSSQAEVSDLAVAMSYVGPTAHAMGISLEDTAIALALLSEGGIEGSSAGTTLNRVLTDLNKTTPKAAGAMAALGIEMYDVSTGKMKPMSEIMAMLNEKLGEGATITEVVGGVTEDLAEAYEKANAKIPDLSISISEQEQQLVILNRELTETVTKYGEGSTQADKKRLAITKLTNDIAGNKTELSKHLSVVGEYNTALAGATTSTRLLTDQERAEYQQAIFTSQGRRGLNVILAGGAAAWDEMTAKVGAAASAEEVAEARTNTFAGSLEILQGTMETLKISAGDPLKDEILRPLVLLLDDLITISMPGIIGAFEWFGGVVGEVVQAAQVFLTSLQTGESIIDSFGDALTYLLPEDTAGQIMGFVTEIQTALEGGWPGIIDLLGTWAGRFWDWITAPGGVLETAGGVLQGVIDTVTGWLTENWPSIQVKLLEWAGKFWDWVTGPGGALATGGGILQGVLDVITGWLEDNWPAISAKLAEWGNKFWDWVVDVAVPMAIEKLGEITQAFKSWAESPEAEAAISGVGETVAGLLIDAVKAILGAIITWAPLGGSISDAIGNIVFSFDKIIENFVGGFITGIAEHLGIKLPPKLTEVISEIISTLIFPVSIGVEIKELKEKEGGLGGDIWARLEAEAEDAQKDIDKATQKIGGSYEGAGEKAKALSADTSKSWNVMQKDTGKKFGAISTDVSKKWSEIQSTITRTLTNILGEVTKKWEEIKKWIFDILANILLEVRNKWNEIKNEIKARLLEIYNEIKTKLLEIYNEIKTKFQEYLDEIKRKLTDVYNEIKQRFQGYLDEIKRKLADIYNEIKTKFQEYFDEIKRKLSDIYNEIKAKFQEYLTEIKNKLAEILTEIQNKWNEIKTAIATKLAEILTEIQNKWNEIKNAIATKLAEILTEIRNKWNEIKTAITTKLVEILTEVQNKWNEIRDKIKEKLAEIVEEIRAKGQEMYNVLKEKLQALANIPDEIRDILISIGTKIIDRIIEGIQAVTDFISRVANKLSAWFYDLYNNVGGVADILISWVKGVGTKIVTWIVDGVEDVSDFVSRIVTKIVAWIGELVNNTADVARDIIAEAGRLGTKVVDWIIAGIQGFSGFAGAVKDTIVQWLMEIFGLASVTIPQYAQGMGSGIAENMLAGFLGQRGQFTRGLKNELASWIGNVGGMTLPLTLAGAGTGGVGGTGRAGGTYSAMFNTNVYGEMDMRRLEFLVQNVLRDMSNRGY